MKKSHGFYSKRSRKLLSKGRKTIVQLLRSFKIGDRVRIRMDASAKGGKIPLRFNGRAAKIVEKQGKAYVVEFRDLNSVKRLVLANVHLEKLTN